MFCRIMPLKHYYYTFCITMKCLLHVGFVHVVQTVEDEAAVSYLYRQIFLFCVHTWIEHLLL